MRKILTTVLLLFIALGFGRATDLERHVVLVVWDGMRPDFVNGTNTPALHELANRGVLFAHNHSVYISSTEVNGTALATGDYPGHSGVIGNREYRPNLDPQQPLGTESLDMIRKADEHGGFLNVPTVAETLQRQEYRTLIAGTKPVVLLQDRAARTDTSTNAVLFEGKSFPPGVVSGITKAIGPFADVGHTKTNRDVWTTRALTELLWKNNVPPFSVLWLAEPDNTEHTTGIGSAESLAAIRNSDDALDRVVTELKYKGVYDTTDVIVVSDHGFSTISGTVDMAARLRAGGFKVFRHFDKPPAKGDVMLLGLGGSVLLYVIDHEEKTVDKLVKFLQTQDSVGTIFTTHAGEGTFALDEARIHSKEAPDIIFSFRWAGADNANGAPGSVISETQGSNLTAATQKATHGSLSPFDMHNMLIAAGPDFRTGFVDETPSGNEDVAPTILKILNVKPLQPMDGRVLSEALVSSSAKPPTTERKLLRAQVSLPGGEWSQTLAVSEVEGVRYLDEGTGGFTPKTSAAR
jgi:arylsulfatase A-like enzyme